MPTIDLSPPQLVAGVAVTAMLCAAVAWRPGRRLAWRVTAGVALLLLGASLLDLRLAWPRRPQVVVMIDRSESMRGLDHDAAAARLRALLVDPQARTVEFGRNETKTTFDPPAGADSIVLISDGNFALPLTAPPVFAVIEPSVAADGDARIVSLVQRGDELAVTVINQGAPRVLRWSHQPDRLREVPTGPITLVAPAPEGQAVSASLNPADRWPENDAMVIQTAPGGAPRRWWIGPSPPPGWDRAGPDRLAAAGLDLLDVPALAIVETAADELSPAAQAAIAAYVRDFGGTLILGGMDRSFSAGGWTGTALDQISPLSSAPPTARAEWVVLLDASGSMNVPAAAAATRWDVAVAAVGQVLPALPPTDAVRVGSFAADLRWWDDSGAPADLSPRGPTNLQPALTALADEATALPRNVLLITDGDAPIDDPVALADRLRRARIRLLALAIDPASPAPVVAQVAEATGGRFITETSPQAWAAAARQLTRTASESRVIPVNDEVNLSAPLDLRTRIDRLRQTWPREGATLLGGASTPDGVVPAAAAWQVGSGRVIALPLTPDASLIERAAAAYPSTLRDPRYAIRLIDDSTLQVRLRNPDAPPPTARVISADQPILLQRITPDTYTAAIGRPASPRVIEVRAGERVVGRVAQPGRFPAEFDAIGLNRVSLSALARRSSGAVIEPDFVGPIQLPPRWRRVDLSPWLAATAAGVMLIGLIAARRG